ncbi:phage baseplate assembly protein V [Sphingobium sp. AN558]|uniref:phage baseplate assembly protein V n=1 Tax=Sphingobium sp. AN558 TaxID=3133442 RepID=UPI0030C0DC0E
MANAQDSEQLTGDVLRLGTIASVDHANATCTVESGDIVTGDLPWIAQRAGNARIWSPPSVGEQCLLASPEGDIQAGIVIVGLYSDACPPPSNDPDKIVVEYPDGATIAYDHVTHQLTATLPAGGKATIEAPDGVSIIGPLDVTGPITATQDVVGGGISLMNHLHGKVQAGSAKTDKPE